MKKITVQVILGCMAFAAVMVVTPPGARASMPVDPESAEGREMLKTDRIKKDPKLFEHWIKKKFREKHGLVGTPESSENDKGKGNNIRIQVHD